MPARQMHGLLWVTMHSHVLSMALSVQQPMDRQVTLIDIQHVELKIPRVRQCAVHVVLGGLLLAHGSCTTRSFLETAQTSTTLL